MHLITRFEDLTDAARYLEVGRDRTGIDRLPPVPLAWFGRNHYRRSTTGAVPLDLSSRLWTADGPATGPDLLANFVRITAGDSFFASPNATVHLYYVLAGTGFTAVDGHLVRWEAGDVLTLPATQLAIHTADDASDAVLFWVHDEPLLRRLGARPARPRFQPTKYPRSEVSAALATVAHRAVPAARPVPGSDEGAGRIQVMLGNAGQPEETVGEQGLRAMFGVVPPGHRTAAHRHPSTGLLLVVKSEPGCGTLLGTELDDVGRICHPVQMDWEAGGALVTPPGMWHAHVNESTEAAWVVSVEGADALGAAVGELDAASETASRHSHC